MKELWRVDLWERGASADAIVITTNGTVKHNWEAVMGRGCAREAAHRFRELPKFLGEHLRTSGNILNVFDIDGSTIVTYPVKHNWWEKADITLIAESALDLVEEADERDWENVVMPRPGCGNGGLSWVDVRPVLDEVLDHRFTVVTNGAF